MRSNASQDAPMQARAARGAWAAPGRAARAVKHNHSVLWVPPFLRAAVDWAVCSQFWADFAQTKICHGARTRL